MCTCGYVSVCVRASAHMVNGYICLRESVCVCLSVRACVRVWKEYFRRHNYCQFIRVTLIAHLFYPSHLFKNSELQQTDLLNLIFTWDINIYPNVKWNLLNLVWIWNSHGQFLKKIWISEYAWVKKIVMSTRYNYLWMKHRWISSAEKILCFIKGAFVWH